MIVVTGGAGFIGSCFVKLLNQKGHKDILIVDRMRSEEKWKNLLGLNFSDIIHADSFFSSPYFLQGGSVEAIFHFGACSDTTQRDVDYLYENNFGFSKKLFEWATKHQIYFSYSSSAAVYGGGEHGFNDEEKYHSALRPINAYGHSKWLFDQWILNRKNDLKRWHGHRFFNVFGPNEYHKGKMRSVILQAFEQAKSKEEIKLFKSHNSQYQHGEQLRDFVYVEDVTSAIYQLWNGVGSPNQGIFNMGTGQARSFKDLGQAVFKALNLSPQIIYVDMPEELRAQYQYFTQSQNEKIKVALPGFKYRSLEEGVDRYLKDFLIPGMRRFGEVN